MNVVPRTFVSPRSCFLVATFTTQSDEFPILTSAGYSQEATPVNASDRPQTSKGQSSLGAAPLGETDCSRDKLKAERLNQSPCFRLDLASPYGHILV